MTIVGAYMMTKTAEGYVLTSRATGEVVGTFARARLAADRAVALTAAAYRARVSVG